MKIRNASRADADILADIIRKAFKDVAEKYDLTPKNCPKHPSNCETQWVETAIDRGVFYFILELDGETVGAAALEIAGNGIGYMERLAVLPEFRRHGLGAALAEHVETKAAQQGLSRIEIGIVEWQEDLQNWYSKLGYTHKGRAEFDHLPFPVAFMLKDL